MGKEEDLTREQIAEVLGSYTEVSRNLIPILQDVQGKLGYLPSETMLEIARFLGMAEAAVYSVATFYNQFRLTPPGKHVLKVCMGTACHMKGGQLILEACQRKLGINIGEVTQDREFSLERVACVGCCAIAPVIVVGQAVHGEMRTTKAEGIITNLMPKEDHDLRGNSEPGNLGMGGAEE